MVRVAGQLIRAPGPPAARTARSIMEVKCVCACLSVRLVLANRVCMCVVNLASHALFFGQLVNKER